MQTPLKRKLRLQRNTSLNLCNFFFFMFVYRLFPPASLSQMNIYEPSNGHIVLLTYIATGMVFLSCPDQEGEDPRLGGVVSWPQREFQEWELVTPL